MDHDGLGVETLLKRRMACITISISHDILHCLHMSCKVTGMLQLTALLIQHTPVSDIHVKINPGPRHFFR